MPFLNRRTLYNGILALGTAGLTTFAGMTFYHAKSQERLRGEHPHLFQLEDQVRSLEEQLNAHHPVTHILSNLPEYQKREEEYRIAQAELNNMKTIPENIRALDRHKELGTYFQYDSVLMLISLIPFASGFSEYRNRRFERKQALISRVAATES